MLGAHGQGADVVVQGIECGAQVRHTDRCRYGTLVGASCVWWSGGVGHPRILQRTSIWIGVGGYWNTQGYLPASGAMWHWSFDAFGPL